MVLFYINYYEKCKAAGEQNANNSFMAYLSQFTESEFNVLLKNAKRVSCIFDIDFENIVYLSYETVKNVIPSMLKNADFENLIKFLLNEKGKLVTLAEINGYDYVKLLSFIFWIKDEIEAVYRLESEYLSSTPDNDMVSAGIRELDSLGDFILIDNFVKQWGGHYSHKEIRQMPYHFIFDAQLSNKKQGDFNKRYSEIINKKKK
jgi:hypothetical protein